MSNCLLKYFLKNCSSCKIPTNTNGMAMLSSANTKKKKKNKKSLNEISPRDLCFVLRDLLSVHRH